MKRRLFLVIPALEMIEREAEALKAEFPNPEFRWLSGQDLHITVVPPWYTDDEYKGEIGKALRDKIAGIQKFDVACSVVRFGPPRQIPRLLWAMGATSEGLSGLKHTAERALMADYRTGFASPASKPIRPHITLARFKSGLIKNHNMRSAAIDWRFPVTKLVLMESVLSRAGAEYRVVDVFPLIKEYGEID